MKNLVILVTIILSYSICYSQVDAKKYKNGVLLKEQNNVFKSIHFERESLKLLVTFEFYNGTKMSVEYSVIQAGQTVTRGQKSTGMDVKDKDGLKTSFVFVHDTKKVYMLEDGFETHFTGEGVYYE
jgi:hypothetical protein